MLKGILRQPVWWNVSNTLLPQAIHCQTDDNIFDAGFLVTIASLAESDRMLNWGIMDYIGLATLAFMGAAQQFNKRKTSGDMLLEVKEQLIRLVAKARLQESALDKGKGKARQQDSGVRK